MRLSLLGELVVNADYDAVIATDFPSRAVKPGSG